MAALDLRQPQAPENGAHDEPFAAARTAIAGSPLDKKWRSVLVAAEADVAAARICERFGELCDSAKTHWLQMIDAARGRKGRARLGEVNRAVNLAIRPASDLSEHGVADLWAAPLATARSGRGDCEDYAILKYASLRLLGLSPQDMRLVIVTLPLAGQDHAVLAVRLDGRWLMLDNRRMAMIEAAHFPAEPRFVLAPGPDRTDDGLSAWAAGGGPSGDAPVLI